MIHIHEGGSSGPNSKDIYLNQEEEPLSLHDYLILREKAQIALFNLGNLKEDLTVKMQKEKILKEIERFDKIISEFGGDEEASSI
jgi:hypothetical protein